MVGPNPYAAPSHQQVGTAPVVEGDSAVTPGIIEALSQTRPWVLFLGILGFIFAGLMVLGAVGMLVGGGLAGVPGGGAIGVVYLVLAIFYAIPSLYLYRYGSSIRLVQQGYGIHAVEEALRHQKSFWRLVGVMTVVGMILYFLAIIVFVAIGASAMQL